MRVWLVFWRREHSMHWELEEIFHSEHKAKEYIDKMVAFEGEDGFIGEGGQKYHYQIKNWPVS